MILSKFWVVYMRQNEIIHSLCESSIKTECLTGCGKIVINVLTWNTCLLTKCVLMNIIYCPACYNILISHTLTYIWIWIEKHMFNKKSLYDTCNLTLLTLMKCYAYKFTPIFTRLLVLVAEPKVCLYQQICSH